MTGATPVDRLTSTDRVSSQSLNYRELRDGYGLRWKRRRLLLRAFRKRGQLTPITDRMSDLHPNAILAFSVIRNELVRLPHFLDHYRRLGVDRFLIIDNDSTDGSVAYLADQPDVSLWQTHHSYRLSRFGVDWSTWLQIEYGHGHWCLTVDADELLVYPNWETRPLQALTAWLDHAGQPAFGTTMIDLYPKGPVGQTAAEDDPVQALPWFDRGNYMIRRQDKLRALWVQGGVRSRMFFSDDPRRSPTLNKIPLVKWHRRFVYLNSTHSALPRRLNQIYGQDGSEWPSGALLHTKFLGSIVEKSAEELTRRQHFANSALYEDYYHAVLQHPDFWTPHATRYRGWRHLEAAGLMSRGGWV